MSFEFFLARRFLFGQRFGIFRLITTAIAIGGTALGVAALVITLAVMDGFRTDIQDKILGTQPHIMLVHPLGLPFAPEPGLTEAVSSVPGVSAHSPYLYAQALIQSDTKVTGILLRGIDPSREARVTRLDGILTAGSWEALQAKGVILGQELSHAIGAGLGDGAQLIAPQPEGSPIGAPPRIRKMRVVGIFKSGMYEYDANLAYVSLGAAQDLLGLGSQVHGIGIRVDQVDRTTDVSKALRETISRQYWTRTWQDLNRPLFSAMKLERTVMFLILTLIILVSAFTIISNLLLLTLEKAREIGILQALGASPRQVGRIFWLNGLLLGGTGVSLGLGLGVALSGLLERYPLIRLPAEVYYVDRLPIRLTAGMLESVALSALILVWASVLYPARKVRQMDPVQAIRHG